MVIRPLWLVVVCGCCFDVDGLLRKVVGSGGWCAVVGGRSLLFVVVGGCWRLWTVVSGGVLMLGVDGCCWWRLVLLAVAGGWWWLVVVDVSNTFRDTRPASSHAPTGSYHLANARAVC